MALARNVRRFRDTRRLSVRALAARVQESGTIIHPSGISKIEAGKRRTDVDELAALAEALGVHPADLLTEAEPACATCHGMAPRGFKCLACGREGER